MRHDFSSPVSETEPCGVDLDEAGDSEYVNYTLLANGRLPERFFVEVSPGKVVPFDKASIDLDGELQTIARFLARSRDIRLLALEARFAIVAGNLASFVDSLQGMAALVGTYWDNYIPHPQGTNHETRKSAIEALDSPTQILLPLQYATLVPASRSFAPVTYRNYLVATGKAKPRADEPSISLDVITKSLADETRLADVRQAHESLLAATAAIATIGQTFGKAAWDFRPSLDRLTALLASMDAMLVEFQPGLVKAPEADAAPADGEQPDAAGATGTVRYGRIMDRRVAIEAIEAAEAYFRRSEPSSPALILVHQAGSLVGRPLVEVLAALMPKASASALLRFGPNSEFDLDLERMKVITTGALAVPVDELPATALEPSPPPAPEPEPAVAAEPSPASAEGEAPADGAVASETEPPVQTETQPAPAPPPLPAKKPAAAAGPAIAATRAEASGLMVAAEGYFRTVEPSSPVPLLLERARAILNKDFAAIVKELSAKKDS